MQLAQQTNNKKQMWKAEEKNPKKMPKTIATKTQTNAKKYQNKWTKFLQKRQLKKHQLQKCPKKKCKTWETILKQLTQL